MKLAMAQMKMTESITENLQKSLSMMECAKNAGADLIFFPEIQLSPFFPQYPKKDASCWLLEENGKEIQALQDACRRYHLYASPNLYLNICGKRFDASLITNSSGEILGISKMVHISQAKYFYEQDYYEPSDDGSF